MPFNRIWMWIQSFSTERPSPSNCLPEPIFSEISQHIIAKRIDALAGELAEIARRQEIAQNNADRKSNRNFWWTFALTMTTIVVAVIAAGTGAYQGFVAHETLVETKNDQRAWLRVSISPGDFEWQQTWNPNQVTVEMSTSMFVVNEGHLPAFAVHGYIWGIAMDTQEYFLSNDKVPCDLAKQQTSFHIGAIVFPSERSAVTIGSSPSAGNGNSVEIDFTTIPGLPFNILRDHFPINTTVRAILHGCVIYKLTPDGAYHSTRFNYLIEHKDLERPAMFYFTGPKTTPKSDINLESLPKEEDAD